MRQVCSWRGSRVGAIGTSAVLVLCAASAFGQGELPPEKILGKDDAEFARLLSRAGYSDLAEDVRSAMARSGGGGKALEASLLSLEIQQQEAYREPDSALRVERLQALLDAREAFISANADTPEAETVRKGQLDLARIIGEMISAVLDEKKDLENAKELRKRGIEILEQVAKTLEARLEEPEEASDDVIPEEGEEEVVDEERMFAAYFLARTLYFRAALTEEEYPRSVIARNALEVLLDFQLEYSDQLLCYEGFIYEGLCFKLTNEPDSALESFDAAIALRETYEQSAGVYLMAPDAADIVSSGVLQKMLLLTEQGDHAGAVATGNDFLDTTREGWTALKGRMVLSQLAEAYKSLGDDEGLRKIAKLLIDVDPYGPGGQRGREILGEGGGGSLDVGETLKLAESTAATEPDKAIELCLEVVSLLRGTPEQSDMGARTGLLLGALYAQRGWLHESVVAWDSAADRYAAGKAAPECIWRAINGYLTLQGQERRQVYKTLAQERVNVLLERYPEHAFASRAGLIEGQQAEAEQDFARAAEIYERIGPGAAAYEEALYRAGSAWSRQARKLFQERQTAGAEQAVERSEALLQKARTALSEAASKTLETTLQDHLRSLAFSARLALADLFLMTEVKRGAEVGALFEGIDAELAKDPVRTSQVWDRRFRALEAQGKRDEAMAMLDAQIQRNPEASWVETGARTLAPALDTRGLELLKADPKSQEAEALMRKAASYYQLAIRGQLQGRDAVQVDSLEGVADRLYVLGLHFAAVPRDVDSFVGYDGPQLRSDLLELAVRAYETVLPVKPKDHRTAIKLARTLGFLNRWEAAASHYATLFERETFADPVSKRIDPRAVGSKPELLLAYLEWGECEHQVGVEQSDSSRLKRALDIFNALVLASPSGGKLWWQSRYFQLRTMADNGDYEYADAALESIENSFDNFDGGEFGFAPRFVELREEVKKKVRK